MWLSGNRQRLRATTSGRESIHLFTLYVFQGWHTRALAASYASAYLILRGTAHWWAVKTRTFCHTLKPWNKPCCLSPHMALSIRASCRGRGHQKFVETGTWGGVVCHCVAIGTCVECVVAPTRHSHAVTGNSPCVQTQTCDRRACTHSAFRMQGRDP